MILITGAAGKTGRAIIRSLATTGEAVRALVHRPEQIELVRSLGAAEVMSGNMLDPSTMGQAVRGTRAVYHICPNVSPDEVEIGKNAIEASRKAGVQLLVYHSVLHPQIEAMPHHWLKLRVEEDLLASGLDFVILQPAAYMQNVVAQWGHALETGHYLVPYAPETRLSMVDLEDLSQAACRVLTEPTHAGAVYQMVGSEPLAQTRVAQIIGDAIGRDVEARRLQLEVWESWAREVGLGTYQVQTLASMFRYYERHGFWGNPRVLAWLLGRSPTTFVAFAHRTAREWGLTRADAQSQNG